MDNDKTPVPEGDAAARPAEQRRYHTCGQELWFEDQLSGPAYYEETAPNEYAFVTHCPRCKETLTPDSLRPIPI